ncbi:MAG: T9SS type A sorting domain-containing protein [Flavobacteriales bacterium]|nr:T9SS type A sorting domain-containing protein [Flavobacteriales bacterium]
MFAFSQTITLDTSNFTFYNTPSNIICLNQSIDLDLNGDLINDLTILRNYYTSFCLLGSFYTSVNEKFIDVSTHGIFKMLMTLQGMYYFPTPLSMNQSINFNFSSLRNQGSFVATTVLRHCREAYFGVQNSTAYYMVKNSLTNINYSIQIRISQSGNCFQILGSGIVTDIDETVLIDNFYATMDENFLKVVSKGKAVNKQIAIVGMNGQVLGQFESNEQTSRYNISKFSSGLYIIKILDKSNNRLESHKIVKTN